MSSYQRKSLLQAKLDEIGVKRNSGNRKTTQKTSNQKSLLQQAVEEYKSTNKVDIAYVENYFKDAEKYLTSAGDSYGEMKTSTSASIYNQRKAEADDLRAKSFNISKYLDDNKDAIGEDNYKYLKSQVEGVKSAIGNAVYSFSNANDYYSQWESDDHYFKNAQSARNDRLKWYDEQKAKVAELENEYKTANSTRKKEITAEIDSINAKIRLYERGENGWTRKYLDDTYSITEKEDFESGSANRNFENISREQLDYYDAMMDTSQWYWDADGNQYDTFGNKLDHSNVDERGILIHPNADQYKVTDRYGMWKNATEDDHYTATAMRDQDAWNSWANAVLAGDDYHWDRLTEDEVNIYYYLLNTQGSDAASAYLDNMEVELAQRETTVNKQEWTKNYDETGFLGKVFMNAASVPASVFGNAVALLDDSARQLIGEELNPYNGAHTFMHYSNTVRGLTAEDLDQTGFKLPVIDFSLGDIYQVGMSRLDSALATSVFGGAGTFLLGAGAATNEAYRLYQQGASEDQILLGAFAAGAAETLFEYASFDKLVKMKDVKKLRQWVKSALIQGGIEATEEGFTEISNIITNAFIMRNESDWAELIEDNGGIKGAIGAATMQTIQSMFGGFLGGVGAGITQGGKSYVANQVATTETGRTILDADGGYDALQKLSYDVANKSDDKTKNALTRQAKGVSGKTATGNGLITNAYASAKNTINANKAGRLYTAAQEANNKNNAAANKADIVKSLSRNDIYSETAEDIADALVAKYNGQDLTRAQEKLLEAVENDKDVQDAIRGIVANEKSTMGQRSQNIRDFQADVNAGIIAKEKGINKDVVKALQKGDISTAIELATETHYEVSDNGEMVNNETGNVIDPQGLVQAEDGTYMIADKDAGPVSSGKVSYKDINQAVVYETLVNLESRYGKSSRVIADMDLASRNELLALYNPEINKNGGAFVSGVLDAYFYGHRGVDLSTASEDSSVWDLTEQQRKIAWNTGRTAGIKADTKVQSNVDTTYAEAKKILEAGKAKKGSYHATLEDSISPTELNNKQRAVYRYADEIAQGVQTNIRVYNGTNKAQGFYNHATDEIWLNLNAADTGREAIMAFTLAHELVHRGKKGSPAQYQAFTEFLMKEYGKQGADVDAMIAEQIQAAEEFNKTVPEAQRVNMTREKALEEVVSDACQRMLLDTNAGQKLAEFGAQSKENKSFLEDLKRWITELLDKLRNYFRNVEPDSLAAKAFDKFDANVKQMLADMYVDMSIDAGEKLSTIKAAYGEQFADKFLGIKDIRYNLAAVDTHKTKLQKQYSENSSTDLDTIMKRYDKIIDIWNRLGGELNSKFLADWNSKVGKDRTFTIFKAQVGYKYNVELSSMCKKGVPLFEAIDTIVKQEVMKELGTEVLGKAEKEILYDILKQHHFEIPCAICYVEQARQREGVVIDAFLNGKVEKNAKGETTKVKLGWNQVLDSIQKEMKANGVDYTFAQVSRDIATDKYSPANLQMDEKTTEAFYAALKKVANQEITRYNKEEGRSRKLLTDVTPEAVKACFKGTIPANLKIFKVLFNEPSSRFKIQNDLLYSSIATQNLSMAHNELYGLFNSQGGVSGYKTKQGTTIYWGDILGKTWKPDTVRDEGGVRNQSNSDFQMYTLLDQAQMYIDFTAKGYYLQAYTKVLSELKLFGLSRGKINASLIPKVVVYYNADGSVNIEKTMATAGLDENGNPIYDDIEGINHAEAFMLIEDPEYSKSICGICIGYSDAHINKLLDDPKVQQIIGFHDKTDDGTKRYKGARYAKNYNGLNEATKVDSEGKTKTVHIGFNSYIRRAEKKFKFNAETETFEGTINYNGKTYTADDIPRLAVDLYLEMCAKKEYTPAYADFAGHSNYYKLLADFGLYDSQGHYAPHRKVAYNMPDTVPYLDANGKKQTMRTEDYIKSELEKELAVRDSIAAALADTSSDGIIPQFKAAVKKSQAEKNLAENNQEEKSFSLAKSVEESKDLLAFHNITEKLLWDALNRKGLAMPSLAVTNKGLTDFGEISLLFDKSVIDPALNKDNKLYGSDAWTPMQTSLKMNAKFDTDKTVRAVNAMKNRIGSKYASELLNITPKQFKEAIIKADGNIYEAYAHDIGVQTAYAMEKGIISQIPTNKDGTVNKEMLQKQLDKTLDTDDGWRQYRRWLNNISDTVITSYDQATNEDILRHMKAQPSTAKTFKLSETGELIVPAREYSSIKEMRRNKNRLSENAEEATKAVAAEFMEFAKKIGDTQQVVEAINAGFEGRYNIADIVKAFRNKSVELSTKQAGELQALYKKAVELPTQYFEAKPGGTVGLDKVNTAVVPESASAELRQALEELGINVLEYDGTKESRVEAMNSVEDLMFSLPKVFSDAVEKFGTTTDFAEAGFILPGGEMLKFTDDKHSGKRQYDHRAIGMVYGVDVDLGVNHGFNKESGKFLDEFVENGGIRFDAGEPDLNMDIGLQLSSTVPITKAQEQLIRDLVEWKQNREKLFEANMTEENFLYDGPLAIRIDFGGDSQYAVGAVNKKDLSAWGKKSLEYDGGNINADRIIADIRHYYKTGETRQQSVVSQFHYSYSLPKAKAITPTNEQVEQNIREVADMKPVHSVDESKLDKTGKRPSEIFTEYFDKWGWNIHSDELGDIEITPRSVKDEVRHGITAEKIAAIEAIPSVIQHGKIIFTGLKPDTTVYRVVICAPIKIGKNPYYMGVMLQRDANKQRLYIHNVVIEEETPTFSPADLLTTGANENNERLFITNILQDALNVKRQIKLDSKDVSTKLPVDEDTSPRALLANAFEGLAKDDIEKNKIREYKEKVELINAEEQKLRELNEQIKELSFAKGKRDTKKISSLRFDALQASNRINTYDKQLLRLEASKPLQDVLAREKRLAYKKAEQRGKEALKAYREAERKRDEQWHSEVKEKYQASKKKAIETREKREAREKLQKLVLDTVKWISYPAKTDVKCPDILKQPYADFLNGINMSSKRLADGGDPTKNDLRLANAMGSLATALDRIMTAQDPAQDSDKVLDTGYLDLPADFVQKLRDMTENIKAMMVEGDYVVNNMTAAEVRQLSQMIRTLNHAIKTMSNLYANLRFANIEELGFDTMEFMDSLGEIEKTGGMKDFVQWDNALPYYAFKRFGKGGESVFEGLMDAQDKLAFLAKEIFAFQEKTWTGKEAKAWSEDTHTITLPNGNELTLTTADAMSIYCLSRREQGLQHLLGGGTRVMGLQKGSKKAKDSRSVLTIKDVDAIISTLTDRQKQVAEGIQEFMSTVCSEWGNEISMKRFLTRDFSEKFYFPIESNDENLSTKDPAAQQSDLFRLLNISATKPLTPGANNEVIIRNVFDVFTGHASDMARLNAYGMALLDYMKWLNYREKTVTDEGQINVKGVRKSMEKAYGSAAKSYVLNLVKDVNGRFSDGGDPNILMKWMRAAKTASVGNSIRVATLQITSYPRAALVLSPKSLTLGLSKLPQIEKAKKYCGIALWKSYGFYDTNISRSIEDQMKGVTDVKQKLIELSLKGAEWGDAITWGALWNACEYEVASTKEYTVGTEEFYQAVGKKLREVVYRTQVVDSMLTRSQIMRSKSGTAQEAAAFMSEPTLSANILMDAGFEFTAEKRRTGSAKAAWNKTGKYIGRAVAVYAIGQLTAALLEGLWDAWRDEDDEEFSKKYLDEFVENLVLDIAPFNKIPIISDLFEAVLSLFDVGFYSSDKMTTTWITQAKSAVDAWKDARSDESLVTTYGALYKTTRAISSFFGVSGSGIMREAVALWNNTAGAYDPTLKILTYGRSNKDVGSLLLDAYIKGDNRQAESYRAEFEDEDAYQSAVRTAIKDRYDAGEIDSNTAEQYLVKFGGLEDDDAYWKVQEWEYEMETGEDFKKYNDFYTAVQTGKDLKNVIKRYNDNGVEAKTLASQITSYFKPLYKEMSNAERASIKGYLLNAYQLLGYDRTEKSKDIDKWIKD